MIKNSLISLLSLITILACKGQEKDEKMNKITDEIIKLVHDYKSTPVYSLQMNKQGCRLVVEMENNVDYRLVENTGESMMIPLNVMITKSGKQTLKIKIYPKEGENFLTKYAHVQVNIFNAKSKSSSLKDYVKIKEFTLPQGLESRKLPYYEHEIEFDAQVPFDYSTELNNAKDLSKIPDIEKLVVQKYDDVKNICEKSDVIAYNNLNIHSSALVYNTTYTSKDEIKKNQGNKFGIVDPGLKNRSFADISNYNIKFYAKDKIVALWQKNYKPALYIKGENSSGKHIEDGDPLFLYMPEGSSELKVW